MYTLWHAIVRCILLLLAPDWKGLEFLVLARGKARFPENGSYFVYREKEYTKGGTGMNSVTRYPTINWYLRMTRFLLMQMVARARDSLGEPARANPQDLGLVQLSARERSVSTTVHQKPNAIEPKPRSQNSPAHTPCIEPRQPRTSAQIPPLSSWSNRSVGSAGRSWNVQ